MVHPFDGSKTRNSNSYILFYMSANGINTKINIFNGWLDCISSV